MRVELSIVVPFYNEEENIGRMYRALRAAIDPLKIEYELIFVDDGSQDETKHEGRKLAAADSRLKLIIFRRNYGQTPAMVAGVDHASGNIIITMDGDLQNDPADIPRFLDKISEGYDLVVGWRHNRQDKLITRKIPSRIANWLIGKVTGVPIKDNGCSLKAYRAEIVRNVPLYSEMHRFIPAMLSVTGATVTQIDVNHHARRFGKSKYGLSRIYKVLLDLLTIKTLATFGSRPMLWFGSGALFCFGLSALALAYAISLSLMVPGSPLVVPLGVSMEFGASGCFLLFWGALSELVYKTGDLKIEALSGITSTRIR